MNFRKLTTGTYIIIGIITVLILLVGVPAFVNYLMSVHVVRVYGDTPAWIGFLGTYIGSILSGAITLIGVLLTLKHSEKLNKTTLDLTREETRRNMLPKMIMHAEETLDLIDEFLDTVHELERADKSDINKNLFERSHKLFKVDSDFLLTYTQSFLTLEEKFNKNKKLIRNHMVQINEYAYERFRRFEENFKEIHETRIEPIENELLEFQGHIVTKYRDAYDDVITNLELPLNSIMLDQEDLHLLDKILRKLITAEKKYINDLNDIHFELQDRLNEMLLQFSEQFSL